MKPARLKLISALTPYIAVLIGLYILQNAWVAIGLYHFGIIVFLIYGDRNGLLKSVCTGWDPIMAVVGVAMSVMVFPIIYFFWGHMQLEGAPLNSVLVNFGLHGTSWFLFMIYFSTVQPLVEELYWRNYLKCGDEYLSWTDLAFAGYHIFVLVWFIKWYWLVIAFIVIVAAAYIWRYLASKFEGLIVPLLSHAVTDMSIVVVVYILRNK